MTERERMEQLRRHYQVLAEDADSVGEQDHWLMLLTHINARLRGKRREGELAWAAAEIDRELSAERS